MQARSVHFHELPRNKSILVAPLLDRQRPWEQVPDPHDQAKWRLDRQTYRLALRG